ncbi:MAG: acyl-CoA dehydrogenase [Haliea sp.]|nr:MAG: acyl-CoA dehydrogenase [Haliea sp.]
MNAERLETLGMVRDSATAFVDASGLRRIRDQRFRSPGFDPSVWRDICTMGWPAMLLPEAHGGAGLGLPESCALHEVLGGALVPEPLVQSAMAARLLAEAGEAALLAAVLTGERLVMPAWQEVVNELEPGGLTAFREGRVNGRKQFIPMARSAGTFLVTTSSGVVLMEADAPGVSLQMAATQDGGEWGTLVMDDAPARLLGVESDVVEDALLEATLASAAQLLGVAERAFSITIAYLQMRKQFGRAIGSFQSLQHRAVDLKIQLALTRAGLDSTALLLDGGGTRDERRSAVSRAKARASDTALIVTRQAIQLHGAIGYTDEADIGLYLRKAMVLSGLYGSGDLHRRRYARLAAQSAQPVEAAA